MLRIFVFLSLLIGVAEVVHAQSDTISLPVSQNDFIKSAKKAGFEKMKLSKAMDGSEINAVESEPLDKQFVDEAKELAGCALTPPTGIRGLTGGFNVFDYQLTSEAAFTLGVIGIGEFNSSGSKEYYIYDHIWYKNDKDCAGNDIVYGAGVRLVVSVKRLSADLKLSGLSAIAASAEMKTAEVSVNFKTLGISGSKIDEVGIPTSGPYNIEKHIEYMQKIDAIRNAVRDTSTTVTPEIVSISLVDQTPLIRGLVISHGIRMIIDGRNYIYALSKIPQATDFAKETLKSTYMKLIKRADNTPVTAIEKLQAREYLTKAGF